MLFSCLFNQIFIFIIDGFADASRCCAAFGIGSGPIHMNNLDCSGTEYKLLACDYEDSTYHHNSDWSVICNNGKERVLLCTFLIVITVQYPIFRVYYIGKQI